MIKAFTISLIISIFIAQNANAQISIGSADMPSSGDTIRYTNAPIGTFNFSLTGANFNWDYKNLGFNNQDLYKFQTLSQTPYASLVLSGLPFGAFGYKIADSVGQGQFSFKDIYNFFEKNSNSWRAVGTAFTLPIQGTTFKTGGVYSDKDEIFQFPLNYNDYDSSTFKVVTPFGVSFFNVGNFEQKGYRINTVEGWGVISTPYANAVNCIKVKSRVEEIDSLRLAIPGQSALTVGFPNSRIEYKWLSKTEKIPVLEVTGTNLNNQFVANIIRYRDIYRKPQPSLLGPRVNFNVNKTKGFRQTDTFKFSNTTTPNFGNTYEWTVTPNNGVRYVNNTNKNSANPQIVMDIAGLYSVGLKGTNLAGFRDTIKSNYIEVINANTSVNVAEMNSNLSFYPNPSGGFITFNKQIEINSIYRIFDLQGKLLLSGYTQENTPVSIENLSSGKYILLIQHNQQFKAELLLKN
jgi:hypothetical protein